MLCYNSVKGYLKHLASEGGVDDVTVSKASEPLERVEVPATGVSTHRRPTATAPVEGT